jgi:uncharacterized heparinase superfamily protein
VLSGRARDRLRRAFTEPPAVTARRAAGAAKRRLREARRRAIDALAPSYAAPPDGALRALFAVAPAPVRVDAAQCADLRAWCALILAHRFDLLGSGWSEVRHGVRCGGLLGHRYGPHERVEADAGGAWLAARVNRANRGEAVRIWRLVDGPYAPIDWQLDFRSGFRWREDRPSGRIAYGADPGADVKVPWELARMQHLGTLAAAATVMVDDAGAPILPPVRAAAEVRDEILDFMAQNPPRFGVNWCCAMDVAIRATNWLLACDLLRAGGVAIDAPFARMLARSMIDHGRFIIEHLEWDPVVRGNHYLADVAGLMFVAAALPRTRETDGWWRFARRELDAEIPRQFLPDGGSFEASTSYHRLSGEIAAYAAALVQGRDPGGLGPAAAERLRAAGCFAAAIAGEGRLLSRVGDDDSGRFVRLEPRFEGADERGGPVERHDDHRHLVRAIGALFGGAGAPDSADAAVIAALARSPMPAPDAGAAPRASFPHFGLFIRRAGDVTAILRGGPVGQNGRGGHAHNDQLAIELWVADVPVLVDPGTFVYTPLPEWRNRMRATAAHNTLAVDSVEQNGWAPGRLGLFALNDARSRARVIDDGATAWIGEHAGFGAVHRRTVTVDPGGVEVADECAAAAPKRVILHLHPDVEIVAGAGGPEVALRAGAARLHVGVRGAPAHAWETIPAVFSPAYGRMRRSHALQVRFASNRIEWFVRLEPERATGRT